MFNLKYRFNDEPFREFLVAVKEFGRDSIAVGVLGGEALQKHPDADITIGEIAAINEFGTGHTPSRPFIRDTMRNTGWVLGIMSEAAKSVIAKKRTVKSALNRAGRKLADGIRMTVLEGVDPPNAEATVEWKGHGDTLIGLTGALYDAITHKIIPGGKK